jgi:hypothetical protein
MLDGLSLPAGGLPFAVFQPHYRPSEPGLPLLGLNLVKIQGPGFCFAHLYCKSLQIQPLR